MKKAVIYVRGQKEKMQEIICRLYASDKGYKVVYVTTHIEEVNLCDVLLVTNPSRISRDRNKYYEVMKELNAKNIEVESVSNQDNTDEYISFASDLF